MTDGAGFGCGDSSMSVGASFSGLGSTESAVQPAVFYDLAYGQSSKAKYGENDVIRCRSMQSAKVSPYSLSTPSVLSSTFHGRNVAVYIHHSFSSCMHISAVSALSLTYFW
jgi:hypothetical protein